MLALEYQNQNWTITSVSTISIISVQVSFDAHFWKLRYKSKVYNIHHCFVLFLRQWSTQGSCENCLAHVQHSRVLWSDV